MNQRYSTILTYIYYPQLAEFVVGAILQGSPPWSEAFDYDNAA